jgi:hypothetical protein
MIILKDTLQSIIRVLFGLHESNSFTMNETIRDNILQVSREENDILRAPFTEQEIRSAIFQTEHNKAPFGWFLVKILPIFSGKSCSQICWLFFMIFMKED